MRLPNVNVVEIRSERDWKVATIPMPEPTWHVVAIVAVGRREYVVRDYGGDAVVQHRWTPHHKLRRCPTRERILAAVRQHPNYRAALAGRPAVQTGRDRPVAPSRGA